MKVDSQMDKIRANKTIIAFSDIFKHCSKEVAMMYFGKIVNNLKASKLGYVNIKITARFFREYSKTRPESQKQFADLI